MKIEEWKNKTDEFVMRMSLDEVIRCLGINYLLMGYLVCAAIVHIAINSSRILKQLEKADKDKQEAVKPYMDYDGHDVWRCGKCGSTIFHICHDESDEDWKSYVKFCRHCGKAVKWN